MTPHPTSLTLGHLLLKEKAHQRPAGWSVLLVIAKPVRRLVVAICSLKASPWGEAGKNL